MHWPQPESDRRADPTWCPVAWLAGRAFCRDVSGGWRRRRRCPPPLPEQSTRRGSSSLHSASGQTVRLLVCLFRAKRTALLSTLHRGTTPAAACRSGLSRESLPRCRALRFTLERSQGRARPPGGRPSALAALTGAIRALRALPRARRRLTPSRWLQLDACTARLGQTDCDGLLGRARTVLSLAHVLDLLAHELTGLRCGRLALPLGFPCTFQCLLFGHRLPRPSN
jgi:hypothetical protein